MDCEPQSFRRETFQNFLNSCDNFLFDCDGVVWNWPKEIPGSVEFINKLKLIGKKCFFVTNNSTRTRRTFSKQLENFGIKNITENQILSTAWTLAQYLKSENFNDKVFLVGNSAMAEELDELSIEHNSLEEHQDFIFDSTNYNEIRLDPSIKCVAIGIDYEFSFQKMIYASSYLKHGDCIFLATNDDSSLPVPYENIVIPDAGSILSSIEKTVGKKALVIGKPRCTMWEILSRVHDLNSKNTCMIGDRLDTVIILIEILQLKFIFSKDILFASNAEIEKSILVFSGITKENDMWKAVSQKEQNKIPKFYANSLGELLKLF